MKNQNEHLETLTEIRSLMERSSRFISLSGLSGVFAGVFALLGAFAAYIHWDMQLTSSNYYEYAMGADGKVNNDFFTFFFMDAILVLIASLAAGVLLTRRKAKQKNQSIWDATAKRMLVNLFLPLASGGLFCLALLYHSLVGLVAPATLIFYGLALINASKYTLNDIRYLGILEIALGIIASFFIGYGLLFWALGFGLLHIVYGIVMYNKYEK